MTTYDDIIAKKLRRPRQHGFEPVKSLNPKLFDWQKLIVDWAIRQGRCALFEECGLGKTIQQLDWAEQVSLHGAAAYSNDRILILCPLAVAAQTIEEGKRFGYSVNLVREPEDVRPGINICNYERADRLDLSQFVGVVLDESSILKSFTGKTRHFLTQAFAETPYRLCCTATPSPNDFTELGQHAEFLGIMGAPQMLATWFINDTADTGTWRLKGHARQDFWRWVASWAACVTLPSDLGFSDDGFILPDLELIHHNVTVDQRDESGEMLFRMPMLSASNLHRELRKTCAERVAKAVEIATSVTEHVVIWCNSNQEADELSESIPEAVEVRGSDDPDRKEEKLNRFSTGRARVIITKPSIAGYGLNWPHCRTHVFVGLSYSFEDFYQAMRRGYRFGQKREFHCHIIQADTMGDTLATIQRKMAQHQQMRNEMRFCAKCLTHSEITMSNKTEIEMERGDKWTLYHGDCVRVAEQRLEPESVGFTIFSPPFANLFTYSSDVQDMGNCVDEDDFAEQFKFIVPQILRVTQPGRLCAVHCVDLLSTKWRDGEIELKNFSGLLATLFRDYGWLFHCRITIWKDPVTEMQRTKSLGLLHKQLLKDSSMSRVGSPEYLLVFRKPGINANPISHNRSEYPVEQWQMDASPVWMDIRQTRTLNGKDAREGMDERHICPLQLDIIERSMRLWSNPGDLVYSPFAGIGSEGYTAVRMRRRFVGSELKESYWHSACEYLKRAEEESLDLFSLNAAEQ